MQICKTTHTSKLLEAALTKEAALKTLTAISIPSGTSWEDAKPIVSAALNEAGKLGEIDFSDVYTTLRRLKSAGVRIGDDSESGLMKEAQWLQNMIGKGLQDVGQAANWAAGLPGKAQQAGQNMQSAADKQYRVQALSKIDEAAVQLNNLIKSSLGKYNPTGVQALTKSIADMRNYTQPGGSMYGSSFKPAPGTPPAAAAQPPAVAAPAAGNYGGFASNTVEKMKKF